MVTCVTGYDLAERLGLEAFHYERGDDGAAYFLEDGRILKTTNAQEAAISMAIRDAQAAGYGHPSVPRIYEVFSYTDSVDLSAHGGGIVDHRGFVILRENLDDIDMQEDLRPLWTYALKHLNHGWAQKEPTHIAEALASWDGPEIQQVLDGLCWVESYTGCRLADIRAPNVGVVSSKPAVIGMRDLSRGKVPEHLLQRVMSAGIPQVPEVRNSSIPKL